MKFAFLVEPPFNYRDDDGRITGSDVELARRVFHHLGIGGVEFLEAEFADLLPGLVRGDWQMTTGLFATSAREKLALFSRPIWALSDGLLIRSADSDGIFGYASLAADKNLTLAVIRDQAQHQTALGFGVAPDQVVVFETYLEAAQAVRDGCVSAYASVRRAHDGFLQQSDNASLASVIVSAAEKRPAFGCFGIGKQNTDLKIRVDDVLDRFIGGAEHRLMMRQFSFTDVDVDCVTSALVGPRRSI